MSDEECTCRLSDSWNEMVSALSSDLAGAILANARMNGMCPEGTMVLLSCILSRAMVGTHGMQAESQLPALQKMVEDRLMLVRRSLN